MNGLLSLAAALSSGVNSYVFYFVSEKMNWTEAQTYCRQHYTDLVTVNDQTYIDELLQSLPSGFSSMMWIGLYRTDEYFPWVWVWSDGSKALFTPWDYSQPNNVGGQQYCVCMSTKGFWSDWWCTDKLPFLCYTGELWAAATISLNLTTQRKSCYLWYSLQAASLIDMRHKMLMFISWRN